jgi:hypothetical protein
MRRTALPLALAVLPLLACDRALTAPDTAVAKAAAARSAARALGSTVSERFPIELEVFVPCAAGGAGEVVRLSGQVHNLLHLSTSARGNEVLKILVNPQGVGGVGLTTGAKYRGTGVTQEIFSVHVGVTDTFVNNFRVIGQGPSNNFLVHEVLHVTVNANGTLTAFVSNVSVKCR